jgi:hypothetical protein
MAMLRASPGKVLAFRAAAHHLTERLPLREWTEALSVGLQDTPAGSANLGLAARVTDVDAELWPRERVASRNLVVAWSLRGAPYAHLVEDHGHFSVAARPSNEQAWLTLLNWNAAAADHAGMSATDAACLVATQAEAVLEDGPLTKADLSTALRDALPGALLPWCRACKVHHVPDQLLRSAALYGGIVFGPDDEQRLTLVRTNQWLGTAMDPQGWSWRQPTGRAARQQRIDLLHRFLSAYGPADARMFAGWLGVHHAEAAHRFAEAHEAGHLVAVAGAGPGRATVWLHVDDEEEFRAVRATDGRGVRLLPPGDPYLAQRDRELLVEDPARQKEVWKAIGSPGVVLVDATVAGTWRPQKKGSRLSLTVRPFEPFRPKVLKAVEEEAGLLARARGTELAGLAIT